LRWNKLAEPWIVTAKPDMRSRSPQTECSELTQQSTWPPQRGAGRCSAHAATALRSGDHNGEVGASTASAMHTTVSGGPARPSSAMRPALHIGRSEQQDTVVAANFRLNARFTQ
jgi:hypothetical protein